MTANPKKKDIFFLNCSVSILSRADNKPNKQTNMKKKSTGTVHKSTKIISSLVSPAFLFSPGNSHSGFLNCSPQKCISHKKSFANLMCIFIFIIIIIFMPFVFGLPNVCFVILCLYDYYFSIMRCFMRYETKPKH